MRFKCLCDFKGTEYSGWQVQPNALSIQEVIQKALTTLLKTSTVIVGCGRTDAGVHARNYTFHFDADLIIPCDELIYKLNRILPNSIAINDLVKTEDSFHARFDALSRSYVYRIHRMKDPFIEQTSWYYPRMSNLDLDLLQKAALLISQNNDFSAFKKTHTDNKTNLCKISKCIWVHDEKSVDLHITADRFLRGMVRLITGACINVAKSKMTLNTLQEKIETKEILPHAWSVPAHGLTFLGATY